MDGMELRDICIKSCQDMYEQMDVMQESAESSRNNISMVINDLREMIPREDYWELELTKKIQDIDRIGLCITDENGTIVEDFGPDDVRFDEYNEGAKTIRAFVSDELNKKLVQYDKERVKIKSDMKWLIQLTEDMYEEYGDRLDYPRECPHFPDGDYDFPHYEGNKKPSQQQRDAVHAILNSDMSYVWGAPGTGKTQMVLSTAIIAHIKKGHRVAIIAPTNNSLEQVLKGVLEVISTDDPNNEYILPNRDIIRLGVPTHEFVEEWGEICEDKAISKEIEKLRDEIKRLDQRLLASAAVSVLKILESIREDITDRRELDGTALAGYKDEDIDASIDAITGILADHETFSHITEGVDHTNIAQRIDIIEALMNNVDKSKLYEKKYANMDVDAIEQERTRLLKEINEKEKLETNHRIKTVKIMAMTPYVLMSRRKALFEEDGIVDVDQIFIDEVGYCNLIQTLPVFMCGPPVAMLGDHMQLPPVCELGRDVIESFYTEPNPDGYMMNGFMWDQSALFIENYLSGTIEECASAYLNDDDPTFIRTVKCDLTYSRRFSDNLAKILDECVYKNGIKGTEGNLSIDCIDVVSEKRRTERINPDEVVAIKRYLDLHKEELGKFVILTPYRMQKYALDAACPKERDSIMTIHSSQGREWNTVILSVCDDDRVDRDIKLRFTSCIDEKCVGLRLINTAASRAQDRLILVCNRQFWADRAKDGELLGKLAESSKVIELPPLSD